MALFSIVKYCFPREYIYRYYIDKHLQTHCLRLCFNICAEKYDEFGIAGNKRVWLWIIMKNIIYSCLILILQDKSVTTIDVLHNTSTPD